MIGRARPCRRRRWFASCRPRLDLGPLEHDANDLTFELGRARHQCHDTSAGREFAGLPDGRALGVAEVVQAVDELPVSQRLTAAQLERPREHAGKGGGALAVQACVDQVREPDVVVRGEAAEDDRRDGKRECHQTHPALAPGGDDPDGETFAFRFRS